MRDGRIRGAVAIAALLVASLASAPSSAETPLDERWAVLTRDAKSAIEGNDLPRAMRLLEEAQDIAGQLDTSDPRRATSANNLGYVLQLSGRLADAAKRYEESLQSREATLGRTHVLVAQSLSSLAQVRQEQRRLDDAERLLRRALEIRRFRLGMDDEEVAATLEFLATTLSLAQKDEEAITVLREAIAIRVGALGADTTTSRRDRVQLARLYQQTGQLAEAERQLRLLSETAANSSSDEERALLLHNLGDLLRSQGRHREAIEQFHAAARLWPKESPHRALTLAAMASTMRQDGDPAAAAVILADLMADRERRFPSNDPMIQDLLRLLAEAERESGKPDQARERLERLLDIEEREYGKQDKRLALTLNLLARLQFEKRDYKRAEASLRRAGEIEERAFGASHPELAQTLKNRAAVLQAMGRAREAQGLVARAEAMATSSAKPAAGP